MLMSCAGMDRADLLVQWLSVSVMHGWRCVYEIWGIDSRADVCFRDATTFSRPLHGLHIHISHLILPRNRWAVTIRPLPSAYCLLLTASCLLLTAYCLLL